MIQHLSNSNKTLDQQLVGGRGRRREGGGGGGEREVEEGGRGERERRVGSNGCSDVRSLTPREVDSDSQVVTRRGMIECFSEE